MPALAPGNLLQLRRGLRERAAEALIDESPDGDFPDIGGRNCGDIDDFAMAAAGPAPNQAFQDQPVQQRPYDAERSLFGKPLLDFAGRHRGDGIDDACDLLLARSQRGELAIEGTGDLRAGCHRWRIKRHWSAPP